MRKNTNFGALILSLLMLLSLSACGNKDTNTVPYTPGTTVGNTYTNEYFGFTVTLDENSDWSFYTIEQLAQLIGQSSEVLDNSESVTESLERRKNDIEMFAIRSDNASISVLVDTANGAKYDESSYVDTALTNLAQKLTNAGQTNVSTKKTTLTFAGEEHYGIIINTEVQGVSMEQTMVCVKVGDYVVIVTAVSGLDESSTDLLAVFKSL